MHALFADTLGGDAKLFLDKQATRSEIENEIQKLSQCAEDDVIVIYFSGHGTNSHEIVTYDTDRNDLENTSIPLDILTEWFYKIPSKRLFCILDCCFSGKMGSKVFQTGIQSKDIKSTDDLIKQLSGGSRLVYTACLGSEEAWENVKIGHGYLTYNLIEALTTAEEVRDAGKVDVHKLLSYVTKKVKDRAAEIGKKQTPTITGRIEGELTFPIFQKGALYTAAFPNETIIEITKNIKSLAAYGFSQDILDAWAGSIKELNQLQLDAINSFGLLRGKHLAASAPTSSGKTMIGELAALHGITKGQRAFFLFPLKALVNDKYAAFNDTYGRFGFKTIRATGENSDDVPSLIRGQYDICLMTYEKFSTLVLSNAHILQQIGVIIVDEAQMIADKSRGANLEFVLTLIKMRRAQGIEPQIIALSAVIGETNGLERWIGGDLLRRTERPVPLDEGIINGNGDYRYIDGDGKEQSLPSLVDRIYRNGTGQEIIIPLVRKLVSENKQVIVFRETKPEARACAKYLSESLGLSPAQEVIDLLPKSDLSRSSGLLHTILEGGVAFHIADLNPEERKIIEEYFRAKDTKLRVIVATTTLAMGVNTPTDAVIIAGLEHPGSEVNPYSIAEYKNMVGRAGRLGFAPRGYSYLVAMTVNEEHNHWNTYVLGKPEDLSSRFFDDDTDPRSIILKILAASQKYTTQGMSADDISLFLEESFGSFQQKRQIQDWQFDRIQMSSMLDELEQHGLLERDEKGIYSLTRLGWVAGKSGLEVESILRVINALKPLQAAEISDPVLITVSQLTKELDVVSFPINRRSTEKEPQTWQRELRGQQIPQHILRSIYKNITDQTQATLRAKKAVACLLWMTDNPLLSIEATLTQFGGSLGGAAGAISSLTARTCDVISVVGDIARVLHPDLELGDRIEKILLRLEKGLPAKVFELAKYTSAFLIRGDYLRLIKANLFTLEAIEQAGDEKLLECIDGSSLKLKALRNASTKKKEADNDIPLSPILPTYEG